MEKANLSYRKQRKHSNAQTRKMTRRLLNLLGKILKEIRRMGREREGQELLTVKEKSLVDIVTKVYRQQRNHFDSGNRRESIPDRIVSVSKPYVRPIVRGKEVKSVEFGAKCNNIMVDGISFIEKLSFNAFNEGTRLRHCVKMHRRLFGVDVKKVGGDAGYAGTDNRDFCKENGIQTSFVKRGRPSQGKKNQDYVRQELARVRATAMEGSFGTRRSITRCDGSRRGRRRRRSCTSSSASTPPTRYAWRSGSWNDRKRKRPSWAAKKVPKRSSTTGIPGCPCEKRRLSTKSGGFEQFWQQKTEQTQPLVATS